MPGQTTLGVWILASVALVLMSLHLLGRSYITNQVLSLLDSVQQDSFHSLRKRQEANADIPSSRYELARVESDGFFTDINEKDWRMYKDRQKSARYCFKSCEKDTPARWYQINYEPTFTCAHERRMGGNTMGDGPKWVCDPHRISKSNCLVYSIGSRNDFRFETAVLKDISSSCEIHTFDPTVGNAPSNKPDSVHFHPWGIAAKTGTTEMGDMRTIQDIIQSLGHESRTIDIFKIDCEGCEWESYASWFEGPKIRQIQVELHGITKAHELMQHAYKNGYAIFHKEPNTLGCGGSCIEYAFLKLNKSFFQ